MKHRILFAFSLLLLGCSDPKLKKSSGVTGDNALNFVLPEGITSLFENKINDSAYFFLSSDSNYYDLHIASGLNEYARITNRSLFIKGKFYPLIFDYEIDLGTLTSKEELIKQFRAGSGFSLSKSIIIHEGFYVRFSKLDKKVVKSGHGLAK